MWGKACGWPIRLPSGGATQHGGWPGRIGGARPGWAETDPSPGAPVFLQSHEGRMPYVSSPAPWAAVGGGYVLPRCSTAVCENDSVSRPSGWNWRR